MNETAFTLTDGTVVHGASVDLGGVRMVYARKPRAFLGCGLFDVAVLDRFGIAAANVRGVSTVEELLAGTVCRVNETALARGVREGMTGREALERL